jgi:signal transduction histidine kinase
MRIASKLVAFSLVVALIPLLGMSWLLSREVQRSLRNAAFGAQRALAERAADAVRLHLDGILRLLSVAGRGTAASNGDRAMEAVLESAMSNDPALTDLWILESDGRVRSSLHRLGTSLTIPPSVFADIRRDIQRQGVHWGSIEFSSHTPPHLLTALPVPRPRSGLLAARVNARGLDEVLRGLDFGAGVRVFLTDDDGHIIARSSSSILSAGVLPPLTREGECRSIDGTPVFAVETRLPERGWRLRFEQPAEVALAPARRMRRHVVRAVAVAVLLAGVLALLLGGAAARALRRLTSVVRRMAEGAFDNDVVGGARDEIGDLARALKDAQPVLERKVRDALLGRMARMIGHDMRQPVRGLRDSLDVIADHVTGADATAVQHFRLMDESLDGLDEFIEDMLTVGRDRPLARTPTRVEDLIGPVREHLRPVPGVGVVWRIPEACDPVSLDAGEARKAVRNALKNAIDAVSPRGGRVEVSARCQAGRLQVHIIDNGPGIPDEKKARLFEEFTTKASGTGLGLLVIKKVMERHGGSLSVESSPDSGTRLTLSFHPS